MEARARELEAAGLARRQGSGFRFERNLIETLRAREIDAATDAIARRTGLTHRSEEHTSELQSLMRISYAVFCLKKKNKHKHYTHIHKRTPLTDTHHSTTNHSKAHIMKRI